LFHAFCNEHECTVVRRLSRELTEESRLADPWLATGEEKTPPTFLNLSISLE
jgi:hypothetical protein